MMGLLNPLQSKKLLAAFAMPFDEVPRPVAVPFISFNDGPFVENPHDGEDIRVRFMLDGRCEYDVTIGPGEWAKADIKYAADWRVEITDTRGRPVSCHDFNPDNRRVRINIDSKSLGDTLAWLPQIERYRQARPAAEVYVSQFWNNLGFADQYPALHFIAPDEVLENCYATYNIGYYFDRVPEQHPEDPRIVPLSKIASDILGIENEETRPRIERRNRERRIAEPYVCIAASATAQCKHWMYQDGWQTIINRLSDMGYSVVLIQKESASFTNIIDRTGDIDIQERITDLLYCDFFVGLGSGLSWLAWALEKPVVLISGFSEPYAEFVDGCYRVINTEVCHGCWNDPTHTFDRGDWNWCPRHAGSPRQFECSRSITPAMVMDRVADLIGDLQSNGANNTVIEEKQS